MAGAGAFADLVPDDDAAAKAALPLIDKLERSDAAATQQGVPVDQVRSPAGAVGRYQVMPSTGALYGFGDQDLTDPATNSQAAERVLADAAGQFHGNPALMAAAYNGGPRRATAIQAGDTGAVPKETKDYYGRALDLLANGAGTVSDAVIPAAKADTAKDPFADLLPATKPAPAPTGDAFADLVPAPRPAPAAQPLSAFTPQPGLDQAAVDQTGKSVAYLKSLFAGDAPLPQKGKPQDTWLKTGLDTLEQAGGGIAKSVGGILRGAGDEGGLSLPAGVDMGANDPLTDKIAATNAELRQDPNSPSNMGKMVADHAQKFITANAPNVPSNSAKGWANSLGVGIAQTLPGLLGTVLTHSSAPIIAQAAGQSFGNSYNDEMDKDPSNPDRAAAKAGTLATVDAAATAIGIKAFGIQPFTKVIGKITNEATGEFANVYQQSIGDMIKNVALQGVAIQPAIGVVNRAVDNWINGKPITDGLAQEYATGAVQNTLILGITHLSSRPKPVLGKVQTGEAPPTDSPQPTPLGLPGPDGGGPSGSDTGENPPPPPAGPVDITPDRKTGLSPVHDPVTWAQTGWRDKDGTVLPLDANRTPPVATPEAAAAPAPEPVQTVPGAPAPELVDQVDAAFKAKMAAVQPTSPNWKATAPTAKTSIMVADAISTGRYNDALHPDNKNARATFEDLTGTKLPKGVRATQALFQGEPIPVVPTFKTTPGAIAAEHAAEVSSLEAQGTAAANPAKQGETGPKEAVSGPNTTESAQTFTTAKGSTYVLHPDGTTTRDKAARSDIGHEGQSGPQPRSQNTYFVTPEHADELSLFQTQGGPKKAITTLPDGQVGIKYLDGKDTGKFEKRTVAPVQTAPAPGLTPVETWNDGTKVHFGNPITKVEGARQTTPANAGVSEPSPPVLKEKPRAAAKVDATSKTAEKYDFESTFPEPQDEALRKAGRNGFYDEAGTGEQDPEALKAFHEEAQNQIGDTVARLAEAHKAIETGLDPRTGKPPKPKEAAGFLAKWQGEAEAARRDFQDHLGSYQDYFGPDATKAFRQHVLDTFDETGAMASDKEPEPGKAPPVGPTQAQAKVALKTNIDPTTGKKPRGNKALRDFRAAMQDIVSRETKPIVRGVKRSLPKDSDHAAAILARSGGIRNDEGHDLVKGRGLQQMIPGAGPLIRPKGMSIDAAGELLWNAGFFGPTDHTPRPTEDEVLQLLERTGRGPDGKPRKVYPMDRQVEVDQTKTEDRTDQENADAEHRDRADLAEINRHAKASGETLSPEDQDQLLANVRAGLDHESAVAEHLERKAIRDENARDDEEAASAATAVEHDDAGAGEADRLAGSREPGRDAFPGDAQDEAAAREPAAADSGEEKGPLKTEKDAEGLDQGILDHGDHSARQLAAAREAVGKGRIKPKARQQDAGGMFAEPVEPEPDMFDLPKAEFEAKQKGDAPAAEPEQPKNYGKSNKVFTEDAAAKARETLKNMRNRMSSGVDPEVVQAGITLAGYHIEAGARAFGDYAKAMLADLGEHTRPYLKMWYNAVRDYPGFDAEGMTPHDKITADAVAKAGTDVPDRSASVEPDRQERDAENQDREAPVPNGSGEAERGAGGGGTEAGAERGRLESGDRAADGGPGAVGEPGDTGVRAKKSDLFGDNPGSRGAERGGAASDARIQSEHVPASTVTKAARDASHLKGTIDPAQHVDAESVDAPAVPKELDKALPTLFPEQRADVAFAEKRFDEPDGHGVMFTNGTGTGKTFTGGGIIKRVVDGGSKDVLVLAPTQGILNHWKEASEALGIPLSILDSTSTAGKGVVGTTYANLGQNRTLADRNWSHVVGDESHTLMSQADGNETAALANFRAITNHPDRLNARARMQMRVEDDALTADSAKLKALRKAHDPGTVKFEEDLGQRLRAFDDKVRARAAEFKAQPRAKAVFLSATPFAYDKNVDYGNGYLFDYGPEPQGGGYNQPSAKDAFFMRHFGYRMKFGKLTRPEAAVESDVMERQFHEWMRKQGVLSGRVLSVDKDYDRKFVLTNNAVGSKIDQALEWLSKNSEDTHARDLHDAIRKRFDYLSRMRLLEAIKAKDAVPIIRKHMAMGRKIVVFHDYNEGGGFSPFRPDGLFDPADGDKAMAFARFEAANPYIKDIDAQLSGPGPPLVTLQKAFPDALVYNGTVSPKLREQAKVLFNRDAGPSGKHTNLIIVQSAAGQAGISLHDTTGNHQRVTMNLGMPGRPTTAIQEEGRTYRIGQASDAVFRYMNTGSSWERYTFASRLAERAGTAENLALGDQARTLRQSFIDAFNDSDTFPPRAGEGRGGKAADRALARATTEFQRAKSFYFAQQKTSGNRNSRLGKDYYATPEPLGQKMVEWANIRPGDRVLEPSAGHGAIARFFPETADRHLVEPSNELASRAALSSPGAQVHNQTFEDLHAVNKYDAIVMNPPFGMGGATAIAHIAKAAGHLRDGGRIVALIPQGGAADGRFDKFMESDAARGLYLVNNIKLPPSTFERAGTKVNTRVVILDKQMNQDRAARLQQSDRDFSDAPDIGKFFDRIEHSDVRERIAPPAPATEQQAAAAALLSGRGGKLPTKAPVEVAPGENQTFTTADIKHGKTGADLFVAALRERVDRDAYSAANSLAKQYGGFYSAFRGKGAVPGFQFKTAEARASFMAAHDAPAAGKFAIAYHGTPHDFDKFDTDAIGTGEGNHTYGWGLYFAGEKKVADYYRNTLSRRSHGWNVEKAIDGTGISKDAAMTVSNFVHRNMDGDNALTQTPETIVKQAGWADSEHRAEIQANAEKLAQAISDAAGKRPGKTFQIDIKPKDSDFLNLDRVVADQSPKVRAALENVRQRLEDADELDNYEEHKNADFSEWTGQEIVRQILPRMAMDDILPHDDAEITQAIEDGDDTKAASLYLKSLGIPGNKYLDAHSRGEAKIRAVQIDGKTKYEVNPGILAPNKVKAFDTRAEALDHADSLGTHNYVLFDADHAKIEAQFAKGDASKLAPGHDSGRFAPGADTKTVRVGRPGALADMTYTPRFDAERQVLGAAIRKRLDQVGLKDVRLTVPETIRNAENPKEAAGGFYFDHVVHVALDDAKPMRFANHEIVHGLRDNGLISDKDWAVLENKTAKWIKKYKIQENYAGASDEVMKEEGVAHAFPDFIDGTLEPEGNAVTRIFRKIAKFFEAVRNALHGLGFKTADDVFGQMDRGETGEGSPRDDAAAFGKKPKPEAEEEKEDRPEPVMGKVDRFIGESAKVVGKRISDAAAKIFPDSVKSAADAVQMALTPMATGSPEARATAKDFANTMRKARLITGRKIEYLQKTFKPDRLKAMWDAADEQSVAMQENRNTKGIGLDRLAPDERAAVEAFQAESDTLLRQAKDIGLFKGEGLPSYVPRMVVAMGADGRYGRLKGGGAHTPHGLDALGRNLKTSSPNLKQRKHLTTEGTEGGAQQIDAGALVVRDIRTLPLAMGRLQEAIAGRTLINNIREMAADSGENLVSEGVEPNSNGDLGYFTIDHPAFKTWRPKLVQNEETGKFKILEDENGDPIFERVPVYVRKDFEGPLRAVLSRDTSQIYKAAMSLKGKTMSVVMYSPLMHNAVIWGKAFPAAPFKLVNPLWRDADGKWHMSIELYGRGRASKNDPNQMKAAIDNGLDPIGHRYFNQDASALMEEPNLKPGRSWTSQILGYVPGLFDKAAGDAVKRRIDQAGDILHNKLLWDLVGDLQMGLYNHMRDGAMRAGHDEQTAGRYAAHFANRYGGALPIEAMSRAARMTANLLMFSRSFTLTNLGAYKDLLRGLPKDVQAQIVRDRGEEALDKIQGAAHRKAASLLIMDIAMSMIGLALVQHAMAWMMHHAYQSPSQNEPDKEHRFLIGYQKDGTAIYGRLPVGKVGEELQDWVTQPNDLAHRKLSPFAAAVNGLWTNDQGFGRKVYDPYDKTVMGQAKNLGRIGAFVGGTVAPVSAFQAGTDLFKGHGDANTNWLKIAAPMVGVTISKGAPGGPAVGQLYASKDEHEFQVGEQMPAIRDAIANGDLKDAEKQMTALGMSKSYQKFVIRTTQNPGSRLSKKQIKDFMGYASPDEKTRMKGYMAKPGQEDDAAPDDQHSEVTPADLGQALRQGSLEDLAKRGNWTPRDAVRAASAANMPATAALLRDLKEPVRAQLIQNVLGGAG